MVLIKTLVFTVLIPGTVTILVPYWLLTSRTVAPVVQFGSFRYVGVLPLVVGAAIYFWCAWDFTFAGHGTPAPFDPPRELVVRGLYRYVRNPMYVGILSILVGEGFLFASLILFEYAAAVFVLYFAIVALYEEPVLRQKFGESYHLYCKEVSRWIPWRIRK